MPEKMVWCIQYNLNNVFWDPLKWHEKKIGPEFSYNRSIFLGFRNKWINLFQATLPFLSPLKMLENPEALLQRCSENMRQIYRRTPMPKCDFKATLLKSHFGMGVLCKFAAYFENTFSQEQFWRAATVFLSPMKSQKTSGFLMFSRGIEIKQPKMS